MENHTDWQNSNATVLARGEDDRLDVFVSTMHSCSTISGRILDDLPD